jgi:putative transposase
MSTLACSWYEESLQVKTRSARKRPGVFSVPPIDADAPNVVWAIDFQFDSTTDAKTNTPVNR